MNAIMLGGARQVNRAARKTRGSVGMRNASAGQVPSGQDFNQKGCEQTKQGNTKGIGVYLPSVTQARVGEGFIGGLQQVNKRRCHNDTGTKVLCNEKRERRHANKRGLGRDDGEEGTKTTGGQNNKNGRDADAETAVVRVAGLTFDGACAGVVVVVTALESHGNGSLAHKERKVLRHDRESGVLRGIK